MYWPCSSKKAEQHQSQESINTYVLTILTDNLDYTSTEQELTLSRNRTTVTVSVPIIDDNLFEDPETLFGNLTIPSGSSSRIILAIRTAQITISNDDCKYVVSHSNYLGNIHKSFIQLSLLDLYPLKI